jgi:hypothetical protein
MPTILTRIGLLTSAFSFFSLGLHAQTNIISVQPIQNSGIAQTPAPSIVVSFGNPYPTQAAATTKSNWSISVQGKSSNQPLTITNIFPSPTYAGDGAVYLQVDKTYDQLCDQSVPLDARLKSFQVVYQTSAEYVQLGPTTIVCRPGAAGGPLAAGTSNKDSDIYVSGSYTGVQNGDPQWNLDSFAGYMKEFNFGGATGVYGQASTSSSKTANFDSFLVYSVFSYVPLNRRGFTGPFQVPYLSYRFAGGEFDHKATQLNFVTSPTAVFPIRFSTGKIQRAIPTGVQWPQMNVTLGVETVDVVESALAPTGAWHTRGLIGANFAAGYVPKSPKWNSVAVTSNWQVRLPSAPEVFYDPKFAPLNADGTKGTTPPMLGTQPRHYLDTTVTYNLFNWVGVTFEYSFGSLPPAFNITDNTFKVGLSLTLKENGNGRNSILRPASTGSK